jgi:major membrane immunogen (membrane-anchored lipoprotein)
MGGYQIRSEINDMRVWAGFMWLRVDSGRLVNTIMNLQVP